MINIMSETKTLNLPAAIEFFEDDSIQNIWVGVHLYQDDGYKTLMKIDREYLLGYLKGYQELSRAVRLQRVMNVYREEGNVYIK